MPDWVVSGIASKPPNPQLDSCTDVYSFGCVMYEMAEKNEPHWDKQKNSVLSAKMSGPCNPSLSKDIDKRYADIMTSCWASKGAQPTMKDLTDQLTSLHLSLEGSGFVYHDAPMELDALTAVADESIYSSVCSVGYDSAYSCVDTSAYSNMSDVMQAAARPLPPSDASNPNLARVPLDYPVIAGGRIRLTFPPEVDISSETLLEYQDAGIGKERFIADLKLLHRLREHDKIAKYLSFIRVINNRDQIDVIVTCINHISDLAADQHSSTDISWVFLCNTVLNVWKKTSMVDGMVSGFLTVDVIYHAVNFMYLFIGMCV